MEALRIILSQSSANYRKEETNINKMTYPLPPFSTVIGAIHNACNYREYKPMDVSIQGKYESLTLEPYTDYCFLNSVMDDRGMLVKLKNGGLLSNSFDKIAKALKSQGNSFREGKTIQIYNNDLLEEYRNLRDLNDKINEFKKNKLNRVLNTIKNRKKTLAARKKKFSNDLKALELIKKREIQIKKLERTIKENFETYVRENYTIPYSRFASLTTSLKYYETLNNIDLVIHIKSDKETLIDIKNNIYNLKSIGRSEDFVDVKEVKIVNLVNEVEEEIRNNNSAYVDYNLVKDETIIPAKISDSKSCNGTKYYINKNYDIPKDKKRVFKKKKVLYISEYEAEGEADNLYFDIDGDKKYIVNFM